MATYYFRAIGGNTSVASNWSLSSGGPADGNVPTSSDNAIFDALSGAATVNAALQCLTANFNAYTQTIALTFSVTVSGNLTFGALMSITGTSAFIVNDSALLTSAGVTCPNLRLAGTSKTYTLIDNWTIGNYTHAGSATTTINGNSLNVTGNFTNNSCEIGGTTIINMTGTGTISGNQFLKNNLNFNTSGTITIGSVFEYYSGTWTYIAGTVITAGSDVYLGGGASVTINLNGSSSPLATTTSSTGVNFYNLHIAGTITNNSVLRVINQFESYAGSNTVNGSNIYLKGSLVMTTNLTGNVSLALDGTGTWSGIGVLSQNLTINTSGTITVNGTVFYGGSSKTLTHTAGTVTTTLSTFTISGACNLNCAAIAWATVVVNSTATLLANITVSTLLQMNGGALIGLFTATVNGSLQVTTISTGDGTATILFGGTGSWSGGSFLVSHKVTINTTGTITISNVSFASSTMTYVRGTIIQTGTFTSTVGTFDCAGMTFTDFSTANSANIFTLTSDLNISGTFTVSTAGNRPTFNGSTINLTGSLSAGTGGLAPGTTTLKFGGTGTWSGSGAVSLTTIINTPSGVLTISGGVAFNTGTLSYIAGNVETGGSTMTIAASATFDTNGIYWPTVSIAGGITWTLSSRTDIGSLSMSGSAAVTFNGSELWVSRGFATNTGGANGTSTIFYAGTLTWSGTGPISCNLTIQTGKITVTGTVGIGGGTFRYVNGLVITTGATLNLSNSPTLVRINRIFFGTVTFDIGTTITCDYFFHGTAKIPCIVQPSSSGNLTVNLTRPTVSHHVKVMNVTSGNYYKVSIATRNANKGGNQGVIFNVLATTQGLPDGDDWINQNHRLTAYINNQGQGPQGITYK